MRRVVALLLVAMVSATVPIGRAGAEASEPAASPPAVSVVPSLTPGPAPSDVPALQVHSDETVTPDALPSVTSVIMNPPTDIAVNQPMTLYVRTDPDPTGGTMTLKANGVAFETQPAEIANSYVWRPSVKGPTNLTVAFSGTADLAAGESAPVLVNVKPPYPTRVETDLTTHEFLRNTESPLVAKVVPDPGPGSVDFIIDGVVMDTAALVAGVATGSVSLAEVGQHRMVAKFNGNADWSPMWSSEDQLWVLGDPVTLDLDVPADLVEGPVSVTATLSVDPGGGTMQWSWNQNYDHSVPVGPGGVTTIDLGTLGPTYQRLYVRFTGYDTWGMAYKDVPIQVGGATATTLTTNRTTATAGELPVILTATVAGNVQTGGTVTFVDDVGGVVVDLATVVVDQVSLKASLSTSTLRVGTHSIRARYNGTPGVFGSLSEPIAVTVAADKAVHATFKASATSFYPYKDGFRDTVSLGGILDEKATVTIRIYNSSGTLKRILSLGTKSGSYSTSWNGRTSTGAALPAGKYTIKAGFKDLRGNVRTIAVTVSMSLRQAVWKSASVVRYGDQFTYYADTQDGRLFYSPDYSRGRTMMSNYMHRDCAPDCAWISGSTSFALNTAGLGFRSILVQMQGHGYVDYNTCTAWLVRPVTKVWEYPSGLPEYLNTTNYHIVVSPTYVDSTKRVGLVLYCTEQMGEAWDVHYLKMTYQYAVWK